MHDNFGKARGQSSSSARDDADDQRESYEITCLASAHRKAETSTIMARDLYDAIGQARRMVGVGEVRISQNGRQLCFLHLESATRWWAEVSESPKK